LSSPELVYEYFQILFMFDLGMPPPCPETRMVMSSFPEAIVTTIGGRSFSLLFCP